MEAKSQEGAGAYVPRLIDMVYAHQEAWGLERPNTAQVAHILGINPTSLREWKRQWENKKKAMDFKEPSLNELIRNIRRSEFSEEYFAEGKGGPIDQDKLQAKKEKEKARQEMEARQEYERTLVMAHDPFFLSIARTLIRFGLFDAEKLHQTLKEHNPKRHIKAVNTAKKLLDPGQYHSCKIEYLKLISEYLHSRHQAAVQLSIDSLEKQEAGPDEGAGQETTDSASAAPERENQEQCNLDKDLEAIQAWFAPMAGKDEAQKMIRHAIKNSWWKPDYCNASQGGCTPALRKIHAAWKQGILCSQEAITAFQQHIAHYYGPGKDIGVTSDPGAQDGQTTPNNIQPDKAVNQNPIA